MKKRRAHSFSKRFYNEGLIVFLYDDGHTQAIKQANPTLLGGFGEHDATDPILEQLARQGVLVAFELEQDDSVDLRIEVRSPLEDAERGMDWLPAQRAPLVLPSGRLHVEGYNNLRLDADDRTTDEPDEIVTVPPNEYVVSLYRRPLDHADATHPRRANVERPRHLVILTEAGNTAPVEVVQPMLRAGSPPTAVLDDWVGSYRIRDGAFFGLGKVTSGGRLVEVNVDPKAEELLGLEPGTVLHVRIPDAGIELLAAYFTPASAAAVVAAMDEQSPPILWVAKSFKLVDKGPEWQHLTVSTIDDRLDISPQQADRWTRATVTIGRSIL